MDAREVPLPMPVSVEAWYLAAIFDELKDLRAELNSARRLTPAEDPVTYTAPPPVEVVAPQEQPDPLDDTQEFPAPVEELPVVELKEPAPVVKAPVKPRKPPVRSQPKKRR